MSAFIFHIGRVVPQCFYCDAILSDDTALMERRGGKITCADCADANRAFFAARA